MKIIVGLGNPGAKYAHTKHNVGFDVVEHLADHYQVSFNKEECQALTTSFVNQGDKIMLVKPLTYMNESGRSVRMLADYYRVNYDDIMIIQDDMDLTLGKLRFRQKGSAGGHNGIKSIIACLGTDAVQRLKIGIQHPQKATVVNWVLTPFNRDDQAIIGDSYDRAVLALTVWIEQNASISALMNRFNG